MEPAKQSHTPSQSVSFEQVLQRNGQLVYTNVGNSMWPLIRQGKDLVVIVPKQEGRLKRYDVPLYRRDSDRLAGNGKYVLHRILKVTPSGYLISGDNQWNLERNITDRHIIGTLAAVIRGGTNPNIDNPRTILVTDRLFRIYTHIWCDLFPLRAMLFWLRDLPGRALRFLRRKKKHSVA